MYLIFSLATLIAQLHHPEPSPNVIAAALADSTTTLPATNISGKASRFGDPDDKWVGGNLACMDRRVQSDDHICAHRSYKCGTVLLLENTRNGKRSWCRVMDRGPYGAISYIDGEKHWYVKIRKEDKPPKDICPTGDCEPGDWRGILDVSPAAAEQLGYSTGHAQIRAWKVSPRMLRRIEKLNRS